MPRLYLTQAQVEALLRVAEWASWPSSELRKSGTEDERITFFERLEEAQERLRGALPREKPDAD